MGRICHMKRILMTLAAAAAIAGPFGVSALAGDAGTADVAPVASAAVTTVLDESVAATVAVVDQPNDSAARVAPLDTVVLDTTVASDTTVPDATSPPETVTTQTSETTVASETTETDIAAPATDPADVVTEPHVVIDETTTTTLPPFDPPPVDLPEYEVPAEPEQGWPVVPIVFPVAGPVVYWDGWGQCREIDCSRLHIGVDIIGTRLQPILAAEDGVITGIVENHRTAGWGVRLDGSSGWQYRYYHLNNDTPATDDGLVPAEWILAPGIGLGSTVAAGQVIGWMGDSGNAETSVPHLHFEVHRPGAREPINPFPSVQAAETAAQCSPMRADLRGAARYEQLAAERTAEGEPAGDVRIATTAAGDASYAVFNDTVYALSDTALNVGRRTNMAPCRWDYRFAEDLVTVETKPDLNPADGLNAFGTADPFQLLLPRIAL